MRYFENFKTGQLSTSIIADNCHEQNSENDECKVILRAEPGLKEFWDYNLEDNCERLQVEEINLKSSKENAYLMETDISEVMNNIINKGYSYCCASNNRERKPAVLIDAPTNAGKTTFVLEYLAGKAKKENKKVLYLVNRTLLKLQIKRALIDKKFDKEQSDNFKMCDTASSQTAYLNGCSDEIGNVIVMTYQSFLNKVRDINKDEIYMVVCDEAHYFIADSGFNDSADIQLNAIIKEFSDSLRIYMSATLMEVAPVIAYYEDKYLRGDNYCKGRNYECGYNYNCSGVKNVYYLKYQGIDKNIRFYTLKEKASDKKLLDEIADLCTKDKFKSLVFVDSKERGKELKKLINKKSNENKEKANIAEYIDASTKDGDTYNQIINKSRFECKVLISTSVLDNGVNIKDKELKNIILLTLDKVGNIQSLGRKRLENKDAVNVYIPNFTEEDLNKKLAQVKQKLIEYEKIKNDAGKYVFDYYKHRTTGNMVIIRRDGNDYKYNTFAYIKFKYEEKNLLKLLDKCKYGSDTCMKELLSWYGIERNEEFCKYTDNEYIIYKELEYYADNKFQTKDKQEFIEAFKARCDDLLGKDSSDRNDRSNLYSIARTNNRLERLKMPFIFKETEDYIFVEYNQEDNITNIDGGEKVQENKAAIRGGDEDFKENKAND